MSHGGDDEVHEEHEEHVNHEAWVIPYADLLTLLMAMFIALFAMSTVDVAKFKAFAIGFNEALGGGKLDAGIGGDGKATDVGNGNGQGNGPFTGGTLTPTASTLNAKELHAASLPRSRTTRRRRRNSRRRWATWNKRSRTPRPNKDSAAT